MARIGIFGAGYVGLVTGACLAELGHDVVVRDVVREKVDKLRAGDVPIYEPGLEELLARNAGRIGFTLDVADAVDGAEFVFVCVDTPPLYSGDADLSRVWTVIDELPRVGGAPVLVMKSTVPVGTGEKVRSALDQRGLTDVGYVSNPEFTAEGRAVQDFMAPDRIVIGAFDDEDGDRVEALHAGIDAPVVRADVNSAEMIKLASNAFLSTRISFVNEIANVCELVGADVEKVAQGMGLDHRLGKHFLRAGIGFGGSCFDGRESVLVRLAGRSWMSTFRDLYELGREGLPFEALVWRRGEAPEFRPVAAVTRRAFRGEMVEIRTRMGRRLRVTADHPVITRDAIKLAGELTETDWLPLALGSPPPEEELELDVLSELSERDVPEVIVRAPALSDMTTNEVRTTPAPLAPWRPHDIVRSSPTFPADESFWRVVGLYIAEGHHSVDGRRHRLMWSFHPEDEPELVDEVASFWTRHGVKTTVRRTATAMQVSVSSRLLAGWWTASLGLGVNRYTQRIPDAIWSATAEHKRALLAGMWHGDGSWSFVAGGPSVVLEYGTVSRELADGMLRLLAQLGIVARVEAGRTRESSVDTHWLIVSGADQVEQLLDFVKVGAREKIRRAIGRQRRRIAPTGCRRDGLTAWVRVRGLGREAFDGDVYSLEMGEPHTVVTTGGLAVHNCFPKDVSALKQLAGNSGYHFQLLSAVIEVNELQKRRVISKLQRHLGRLRGKRIALLGLAFKAGTDDMREAPSLVLASRLIAEGAEVRAWDPVADGRAVLPEAAICDSVEDAVRDADAAVIVTEWPELAELARPEIRDLMARPLIVDGRNLLDPARARAAGFAYEGIGRPVSPLDVLPEIAEREPELEA